jgi:hypothetical protein
MNGSSAEDTDQNSLWGMNNILAFVSGVMIMVVQSQSSFKPYGMTRRMVDGR